MNKNKVTSSQFFICLFLCNMFAVFGLFKDMADKNPFWFNILTAVLGILLFILACVPSLIISGKTEKSLPQLLSMGTKSGEIIIKGFYIMCFTVFISVIINKYAEFMKAQINSDLTIAVVIAVFTALGGFCCYQGIQPLFRTAVIVVVFVIISLCFVFFGLLPSINYVPFSFTAEDFTGFISNSGEFLIYSLIPVSAFAVFFDSVKGNIKSGLFFCALCAYVLFFAVSFFIDFVLGEYARILPFPSYTISKVSRISMLKGGDGLLFGAITASVFLFVYLFFSCSSKVLEKYHSKAMSAALSALVFILSIIMLYVPAVYNFLSSPVLIFFLTSVSAVIIPLSVYAIRKKEGEI